MIYTNSTSYLAIKINHLMWKLKSKILKYEIYKKKLWFEILIFFQAFTYFLMSPGKHSDV